MSRVGLACKTFCCITLALFIYFSSTFAFYIFYYFSFFYSISVATPHFFHSFLTSSTLIFLPSLATFPALPTSHTLFLFLPILSVELMFSQRLSCRSLYHLFMAYFLSFSAILNTPLFAIFPVRQVSSSSLRLSSLL